MKPLYLFVSLLFCCLFGTLSAQTTVITHGYNFPGIDPISRWMADMGEAIIERHGGGTVYKYESETGEFVQLQQMNDDTAFAVLLFEWAKDSDDPEKGHSEAAGNALFCALLTAEREELISLNELHMIGHSRGCVVNSEATERLLQLGYPVAQLTFLDAHDWGLRMTHTDYYVNSDELNSGIVAWDGVVWADSYWHDAVIGLSGRAIEHTYSKLLDVARHGDVYRWYTESVRDQNLKEGYYYSLFAGGKTRRPEIGETLTLPEFDFLRDGVFNGNFRYNPPISNRIPGWSHHGGAGNGHVYLGILELDLANHKKQHDRVYVHPKVSSLVFDLKRTNSDNFQQHKNKIDQFLVRIDQEVVFTLQMKETDEDFETKRIDLTHFQDQIITFGFELMDEHGSHLFINSEVKIDNVRFE